MKRRIKCAACTLAGGLVVVIIAYVAFAATLHSQLKADIARTKVGRALADDASDAIPDTKNAAIIYARVLDESFGHSKSECISILHRYAVPDERDSQHTSIEEVGRILRRCESSITKMEQAADMQCRYPVDWSKGNNAKFDHIGYLRALGILLRARALYYASDGNANEAARSIQLILSLSHSLRGKPTTRVEQNIRQQLVSSAAGTLRQVMQIANLDELHARTLYTSMTGVDLVRESRSALEIDRDMGLMVFDRFRKGAHSAFVDQYSADVDHGIGFAQPRWREIHWSRFACTKLWAPLLDSDELSYLRYMQKQLRSATKPYRLLTADELADPQFPRHAYVCRTITPAPGETQFSRDLATARMALAQTALALQVYRSRLGAYPDTLAQLRAAIGWKLPQDPFSGSDLCYSKRKNSFLLYSIGPDLIDGKGVHCRDLRLPRPRGDIVWSEL